MDRCKQNFCKQENKFIAIYDRNFCNFILSYKFILYCFTMYAVLNLLVLLETGMLNIHDSTQLP